MKTVKFVLLAVLSLLFTACGAAPTPTAEATAIPTVLADTAIVSEGRLEPVRYAEIALNASGLVSEVLVTEGEEVSAGQVIARLESGEARTLEDAQAAAMQELTAAYQGVRDAQFKLDNFDVPSDFSGMTPTEAVEMTLEKLNAARSAYEPYENYNPSNSTAKEYKKRLDDAWSKYRKAIQWLELESNLENAQARLAQAQKDYDALQDPSFAEDTAGARAALANAEVRAPFAGVITSLDLKVGEFASAGQPVVTIADTSSWVVKTTDLTEIDVVSISEGQPATVKLDAIPDAELKGNVLSIGQSYSESQGDVVYEVTILLTDVHPAMRWGMTAEVKFE
ncbi:MAG: HlyD family efflux transporter periplasmic adaptor subunit [Chloroflexota bacterium]